MREVSSPPPSKTACTASPTSRLRAVRPRPPRRQPCRGLLPAAQPPLLLALPRATRAQHTGHLSGDLLPVAAESQGHRAHRGRRWQAGPANRAMVEAAGGKARSLRGKSPPRLRVLLSAVVPAQGRPVVACARGGVVGRRECGQPKRKGRSSRRAIISGTERTSAHDYCRVKEGEGHESCALRACTRVGGRHKQCASWERRGEGRARRQMVEKGGRLATRPRV